MKSANKFIWFWVVPLLLVFYVGHLSYNFIKSKIPDPPAKSVDELDAKIKADTAKQRKWEEDHGLATPSATPKAFKYIVCELGGRGDCWNTNNYTENDHCIFMAGKNEDDFIKICTVYSIRPFTGR